MSHCDTEYMGAVCTLHEGHRGDHYDSIGDQSFRPDRPCEECGADPCICEDDDSEEPIDDQCPRCGGLRCEYCGGTGGR